MFLSLRYLGKFLIYEEEDSNMTEMSIVYEALNAENDQSCFLAESIIVRNENNGRIVRHASIIK